MSSAQTDIGGAVVPELFGTDGIRGAFSTPPLDEQTVRRVTAALAESLQTTPGRPAVVVGGDTRVSTPTITTWIASTLAERGIEAIDAGVIPTPGVAYLVRELSARAGVVISASHNPLPDNGIKIFDEQGFKLDRARERALEKRVAHEAQAARSAHARDPAASAAPEVDGSTARALVQRYHDHLVGRTGAPDLAGLKVLLDAGNGAASYLAGSVFAACGAEVEVTHDHPDGSNINRECGSTAPELMARQVREGDFDLGFAFDGDADRMIPCDEQGALHDGDAVLFLWGRELAHREALPHRCLVATSMSNLALERALSSYDITVRRCGVGDRQVVETMRRFGLRLGGEQSGHLIDLEAATTGDGLLSALEVAAIVAQRKTPLAELLSEFRPFPQRLHSVAVARKPEFDSIPDLAALTRRVEQRLGDNGRLVLRYSGTEDVARIMVEAPDQELVDELVGQLVDGIERVIGR